MVVGAVRVAAEDTFRVSPTHGESNGWWEDGYSSLLREGAADFFLGEAEPGKLCEVCEPDSYFLWSMYVN